jgi:hypothetical protein
MSLVRTTLDLPDPLFRELKARAALEGVKMKELIRRLLEAGLGVDSPPLEPRRQRSALPFIPELVTGTPIPALSREELARIEEQEDLDKLDRSSGR